MPDTIDSAGSDHEPSYKLRQTAPQQAYTMRQVGFGLIVVVIGLAIAYALPLLG